MRTKAKIRLTVVLILISFLVISVCSITAIFALTEQNTKTRVDIIYTADVMPLEEMTFTLSSDGTSCSVTDCDYDATGIVIIPKEYEGLPVTSIGTEAFSYRKGITNVVIPDSVTTIGIFAFEGCEGLIGLTIGSGVTSIDDSAFYYCNNLSRLVVDENNSKYHSDGNCLIETSTKTLVRGCKTSVIPTDGSVTSIGESAFERDNGLTEIVIPDSITSIGKNAFLFCSNLTKATIGRGLTSIDEYAFWESGLTEITIPNNITTIESHSFDGCDNLNQVVFEEGIQLETIGSGAFSGCKKLNNITIPASVTRIEHDVFRYCESLTEITIPVNVNFLGSQFVSGCDNLTSLTVETGNTTYYSDGNCIIESSTKKVEHGCKTSVIPTDDSVTGIGIQAFSGTAIKEIKIPSAITSIGGYAFYGCNSLTSAIFENPKGWWSGYNSDAVVFSSSDLSNPETAASYLKTHTSQWTRDTTF